ncbi:DUF4231 domain-containing protein [Tengunoibacter tsumagoiensis]|uniref:SMODS and SLOG-associating 2TM effector domain-containing protein n=1 Tax=Tengunoibacter tsumagoiensis TaxID=2014871 RepID=A0A402A1Y3_9CHLR|nr:DUF4231 domain-containing protein [Tengunoibacter tsumagoiensis]GCE13059.1 hypothetical protein KTT_29180 [Tengunoibacter tsumagoiensis]
MQESKEERYLTGRWSSQQKYYSKRASRYKNFHLTLLCVSAIGAVLVPLLLSVVAIPTWISIIISALVSVALVVDNAFHFGESWQVFRHSSELLKRERVYFESGTGPYLNVAQPFPLFVQRSEEIISAEGASYFDIYKSGGQARV